MTSKIETKTDKNGRTLYYILDNNGKKTRISRDKALAEIEKEKLEPTEAQISYAKILTVQLGHNSADYDFTGMTRGEVSKLISGLKEEKEMRKSTEKKEMKQFRGSRWAKIHQQGEANFEAQNNIIDIMVGEGRCRAEVTYATSNIRNFKKAAHMLCQSLAFATRELETIVAAAEQIKAEADKATDDVATLRINGEIWACEIEKLDKGVFRASMDWKMAEGKVA